MRDPFGRSLHLRLLAGAAIAILAALVVAWLTMTALFQRHIERREASELTRYALTLVAGLHVAADGALALNEQPADARFDAPAGGLYWQIAAPSNTLRSRSLWDQTLKPPTRVDNVAWRTRTTAGPFGGRIFILERSIAPDRAGPKALVQIATDERELAAARQEFGLDLALFLAGLWLVLSAAAYVQVRLGLQPLTRLGADLQRLRRNPTARLASDHPQEIEPLIGAINALADARQDDVTRARRRAGDLAHSLKTPLAALSAQSRRARAAGATDAADGLDRAITAVGATLEAELARARAGAARDAMQQAAAAPKAIAQRVVDVVERTDSGAKILFDIDMPDDLRVPAPEDIVMEILGALVENAAKFAHRRVRIAGAASEGSATLIIEDDGPGIDEGRTEAALIRGGRLDEAGPGHGLGLAIVRDLVEATDGAVSLDRSPLNGLRVAIAWPASA